MMLGALFVVSNSEVCTVCDSLSSGFGSTDTEKIRTMLVEDHTVNAATRPTLQRPSSAYLCITLINETRSTPSPLPYPVLQEPRCPA